MGDQHLLITFDYGYPMTASEIPRIRRRWYVFALGILTAGVIIFATGSHSRVYTIEARVNFSPPISVATSSPYAFYADTMLAFTSTVDRVYNGRHPSIQLSTPKATLFGNGVREGVAVAALKTGNQWRSWQDRSVIVGKANPPSEAEALALLHGAIVDLSAITAELQDSSGVPQSRRIVAQWDEREYVVESFGRSLDSASKGAAAIGLVAVAISALVASGLDKAAAIRERRRPRAPTATRHSEPLGQKCP